MRTRLLVILVLLTTASTAGVYRWKDEHGVIHYADRRVADAEELSISSADADQPTDETISDTRDANDPDVEDRPTDAYSEFHLAEPEANQTVRTDAGEVSIAILLEPALSRDHEIQLVVDGRSIEGRFSSTQLTLRDVGRGSHTLQAKIVDGEGVTVASTQVVNFHVRKAPLSGHNTESPSTK